MLHLCLRWHGAVAEPAVLQAEPLVLLVSLRLNSKVPEHFPFKQLPLMSRLYV